MVRTFMLLTLAVVVAAPLSAIGQEKKKAAGRRPSLAERTLSRLEKAELTEEQIAKIKELAAEAEKKAAEIRGKAPISADQRKARSDALKQAQEGGKKGKEARDAADAAANLTDEQKAAESEAQEIIAKFNSSVNELLSAEQKEKVGIRSGKKKKQADTN